MASFGRFSGWRTQTLLLMLVVAMQTPVAAGSGNWQVIGVGNGTCGQYWLKSTEPEKREVFAWMAGYASSENWDLARNNKDEYRLEFLTEDYLRHRIDAHCSKKKNYGESMHGILTLILRELPKES